MLLLTCISKLNAGLAQSVEQLICNQWVGGSNPSSGTIIKKIKNYLMTVFGLPKLTIFFLSSLAM